MRFQPVSTNNGSTVCSAKEKRKAENERSRCQYQSSRFCLLIRYMQRKWSMDAMVSEELHGTIRNMINDAAVIKQVIFGLIPPLQLLPK